jgi:glycosyltransferase involved in cell wall biosynthesis
MRILLPLTGKSFLPEVPAYVDAFSAAGHEVIVLGAQDDVRNAVRHDVVIRFGGLLRNISGLDAVEIHEYHNASTTRFPRSKNLAKSVLSTRPAGRVFVTDWVRRQFHFRHGAPHVVRTQGASEAFLAARDVTSHEFDIVFAGSLSGRPGLHSALAKLGASGATIGVAGVGADMDVNQICSVPGVHYVGRLDSADVPKFISQGRFALNYCPNLYPWNQQVSTKVVEYLVAGRPIISNRYPWIEHHSRDHGYHYISLDSISTFDALDPGETAVLSLSHARQHLWPEVLRSSGLVEFVENAHQTSTEDA